MHYLALVMVVVLAYPQSEAAAQSLGQVQAPHPIIAAITADIRASKGEIEKLTDIVIECLTPASTEPKTMLDYDRKCHSARRRWDLAHFRPGSAESKRIGEREIDNQLTNFGLAQITFRTTYEIRQTAMRTFIAASQLGPEARIKSAAASVRKANNSFLEMQREMDQYVQNLAIAIQAARQE